MGRKIKFRAWDVVTNTMIYNGCFQFDQFGDHGLRPDIDKHYVLPMKGIESGEMITENALNGWHLMQFTGLTDKNGKEIYEGDILFYENQNRKFKVIFEKGCFWAECLIDLTFSNSLVPDGLGEVIGNIFEQLEEKKGETK